MPPSNSQELHSAGLSDGQQTLGIVKRHHIVVFTMYQQHRAAHAGHAVDRRNIVKPRANDALHMAQHIPADAKVGNMVLGQQAPHHLVGVGKNADADHGPNVVTASGAQQRGASANRMADQRQSAGVNPTLHSQPVQTCLNVLRKARQRRKRLVATGAMTARIQQQYRKTRVQ